MDMRKNGKDGYFLVGFNLIDYFCVLVLIGQYLFAIFELISFLLCHGIYGYLSEVSLRRHIRHVVEM